MSKVSMIRGRAVMQFDWPAAQKRHSAEVFGTLARAFAEMNNAADASRAKLEALSGDPNFTQVGRQNQMREHLKAEAVPALRKGREALRAAEDAVVALRAKMTGSSIDKADAAGAVLRSDLRRWLRDLDPAARNARVATNSLPREAVLAVLEAPAELSGFTPDQKSRLEANAIIAMHPEEAQQIAEIEEAIAAVVSAERAASLTLQADTGAGREEIEQMLGGTTLSERIKALMGEDDESEPESEAA